MNYGLVSEWSRRYGQVVMWDLSPLRSRVEAETDTASAERAKARLKRILTRGALDMVCWTLYVEEGREMMVVGVGHGPREADLIRGPRDHISGARIVSQQQIMR